MKWMKNEQTDQASHEIYKWILCMKWMKNIQTDQASFYIKVGSLYEMDKKVTNRSSIMRNI